MKPELVDEKKLERVYSKVRTLVRRELGIDDDGDSRVEVILVDRSRFERLHYEPVPYSHKRPWETETEYDALKENREYEALTSETLNLRMAVEALDRRMKGMRMAPIYKMQFEEEERARREARKRALKVTAAQEAGGRAR